MTNHDPNNMKCLYDPDTPWFPCACEPAPAYHCDTCGNWVDGVWYPEYSDLSMCLDCMKAAHEPPNVKAEARARKDREIDAIERRERKNVLDRWKGYL